MPKHHAKQDEFLNISWRRYLLPSIHPEGVRVMCLIGAVFLLLGCAASFFWYLGLIVFVFGFYFFRNPARVSPTDKAAVLAPADGIVCAIAQKIPPKSMDLGDEPLTRVSTFMSVFNVHVNRAPVGGKVCALCYHKGKFVNVAHKDSEDNERQDICIQRKDGIKIGFVQIAGLIARRIYCPLTIGQEITAGQVFGLIRFGSRLDVYLPKGVKPVVRLGQTMTAGETILATLGKENA